MPASGQITIRATPDFVVRVKEAARAEGKSMNEFVTHVLEVTIDPSRATSEDERLVARLRSAGLLAEGWSRPVDPPSDAERAKARAAMGVGTSLSELVSLDRGE